METMEQGHTIKPFPAARQIVRDAGRLGSRRHIIYGLLEIDVTQARAFIRSYKADTGQSFSFTAFVVGCLAAAAAANPSVHAYRAWRRRLVEFADVDVVVMIETERDHVALPHIIRAANRKTVREIHHEIRAVQAMPARSEQARGITALAPHVPGFIRDIFYWVFRQNPHWMKARAGTVMVTSVGLFGQGAGWGLTFLPFHTLGLTVGGIAEKPGVAEGRIAIREYLSLTLGFDHDIVDGAPAARFAQQLKALMEQGYGLCQ